MAWDSSRQVPWKKLGIYLALYAAIVFLVFVATNNKNSIGSSIPGLIVGVVIAGTLMVVLTKFGWTLPFLRSKEEVAALRQARIDARRQRGGGRSRSGTSNSRGSSQSLVDGPRPKPAPTSRTTTGPSQHRRHTTKTRKH